MKAIVHEKFGPPEVLQLKEVAKPTPKPDEILVRVRASAINFGDLLERDFARITPGKFNMPFLFWLLSKLILGFKQPSKPKILGSEFSGEVEAIGTAVRSFKPGDRVFGYMSMRMGANAQYLCIKEKGCVVPMPGNMDFAEAAGVPYGAMMALNLLKKANIQPGQKVLVFGASGGIGSAAVQLASAYFGAEVTGVCSTPRMDWVKNLGAHRVIDYTRTDFTTLNETYDVIFDILGRGSWAHFQHSLNPKGIYLLASFKTGRLWQMLWTKIKGGKRVICALSPERVEDLRFIRELVETGRFKSIVDRCFPLEEAVVAHHYIESGQKKGSVVLTISHHETTSAG